MSILLLSLLIPFAYSGSDIATQDTNLIEVPNHLMPQTPVPAITERAHSKALALVWLDASNKAVRSGTCYEKVVAATCRIPDVMLLTIGWGTDTQHYRAILDCNQDGNSYMATEIAYESEVLSAGKLFCRDKSVVYVTLPDEK
jgi:hypothetical protein